jgi:cyclophilin family peptidyl-prolyl cis-trans isomerase
MDPAHEDPGARARTRGRRRAAMPLLVALAFAFSGACGEPEAPARVRHVPAASAPRDVAVLAVEGFGEIRIELLADLAPRSAAHFAALAERGAYDGTTFHRVAPGLVQGGDPNTRDRDPRNDGLGGLDDHVPDERPALSHVRGIVSLANLGVRDSAGSQFFIVATDALHLDGSFAAFGRVVEGMDVVDRIAAVERDLYGRHGPIDRPLRDVVVREVRVERAARGLARRPAVP